MITTAIGKDRRIGSAYLKGALGYGGPCFRRDNIAFARAAQKTGTKAELAMATHRVNESQVRRVIGLVKMSRVIPPSRVGILGLTYKPNTNVLEASQSLLLANALAAMGYEVHAYDPALLDARADYGMGAIKLEKSALDCVRKSELCILATPWEELYGMNESVFTGKVVLDCWRIFGRGVKSAARYVAVGRGLPPRSATGSSDRKKSTL